MGTDELEETFINPLTNKPYPCIALIKDTNDIRRASNNGEPLVYSPNNDFTKSIGKIVSQIVDEEHALEQPEKKGLFARLFGKEDRYVIFTVFFSDTDEGTVSEKGE